jgi:peptide/nickel transport system permease protein
LGRKTIAEKEYIQKSVNISMKSVTGYPRLILFAVLAFFLLTILLFIYWRSYPNEVLVSAFVNPHSPIPRSVQIVNLSAQMHLNEPLYLQYAWFIEGIFAGNWATIYRLCIETFLPASLLIILASLFISFLFVRVTAQLQARIVLERKKSGNYSWFIWAPIVIIVPLISYYLMLAAVVLMGYEFDSIFGSGSGLSILSAFQNSGYISQISENGFRNYALLIHYSGNPFWNALIQGSMGRLEIMIVKVIPPVLSVSLMLFSTLLAIRGSAWKNYLANHQEPGHGTENNRNSVLEANRAVGRTFRQMVLEKAPYLVFLIIISLIYTESLLRYTLGLGFWYTLFFLPYITATADLLYLVIWPIVYITLIYGIMLIIGSFLASAIKLHLEIRKSKI